MKVSCPRICVCILSSAPSHYSRAWQIKLPECPVFSQREEKFVCLLPWAFSCCWESSCAAARSGWERCEDGPAARKAASSPAALIPELSALLFQGSRAVGGTTLLPSCNYSTSRSQALRSTSLTECHRRGFSCRCSALNRALPKPRRWLGWINPCCC